MTLPRFVWTAVVLLIMAMGATTSAEITIEDEDRCSPYNKKIDYHYPQSVELEIIERMDGKIMSPYTGEVFNSRLETDIEHIVATSEAHDSGMCKQSRYAKTKFAQDLDNLTLASPSLNRYDKAGKDLAEWVPPQQLCWYVTQYVMVKDKWGLSMDIVEAEVALNMLAECLREALSG